MKTLIIDNYDLFTFNLYQMIAEVNGTLPTVVTNDAHFEAIELPKFDNVVISPGPGRSERMEDFGICRRVLEQAQVPVLGVCPRHQGLTELFSARFVLAPESVHGRASAIYHDELRCLSASPKGRR